ncbi:MAG: outer membrane beta-barrel protein [Candidatus Acidiferrum sp.]
MNLSKTLPVRRTHPRGSHLAFLKLSFCFLLFLLLPLAARAQQSPFAVSVDYSFLRAYPNGNGFPFNSNGASASASWNLKPWLGLAADFGGYNFGGQLPGVSGKLFTYAAGPRFSRRFESSRWTPFVQVLAGGARVTGNLSGVSASENGFSLLLGGGVDARFRPRITFRPFEFDYLLTRFNRVNSITGNQNDFRISVGVVFHFGPK